MIGTQDGVHITEGKFVVRGTKRELAWGFSAFKLFNYIAQHFAGHGDDFSSLGGTVHGALNIVRAFVESRQALVGREDVWFRVFTQTADGEPGSWHKLNDVEEGMFGSPPHDPGLWDYQALRNGNRPESVTGLMKKCLEWLFQYSQDSGACFELVVNATIKHMDRMDSGTVDQMVRQMAGECRRLQERFPFACVILSTDNEWDAHNVIEATLGQVNMRAKRFYRWKDANGGLRQSFTFPGGTFAAEQWPEGIVIVDHGGKDFFEYECGPEPDRFKMGAIHPDRKGNPRDWRDISSIMARLHRDARGMPVGFTESMYYVDNSPSSLARADRVYRNKNGWHANADDMMLFYQRWVGKIQYGIIHTEKDVQVSTDWPMAKTPLEERLEEFFGTGQVEPPPPPPPAGKVRYEHIATGLYDFVLQRTPDPAGLAFYDEQLRLFYQGDGTLGLSYDNVRDAMLRSEEYARRFKR